MSAINVTLESNQNHPICQLPTHNTLPTCCLSTSRWLRRVLSLWPLVLSPSPRTESGWEGIWTFDSIPFSLGHLWALLECASSPIAVLKWTHGRNSSMCPWWTTSMGFTLNQNCRMWVGLCKSIMRHLILLIAAIGLAHKLPAPETGSQWKWQTAVCPQK